MLRCYVKESTQHGKGVFASTDIRAGEPILSFGGPLLHRSQVDFNDYHLQVDDEHYLGPSRLADDYVNHSCDPNAGFRDGLVLVALRDIAQGEEITWDYSTAIDEPDFEGFACRCHTPRCRGLVASYRHLPGQLRAALWSSLVPYLKRRYQLAADAPG
jgi:SET domain-containing protein